MLTNSSFWQPVPFPVELFAKRTSTNYESCGTPNTLPSQVIFESLLCPLYGLHAPPFLPKRFDHSSHTSVPVFNPQPVSISEYIELYSSCFEAEHLRCMQTDGNKFQMRDGVTEQRDTAVVNLSKQWDHLGGLGAHWDRCASVEMDSPFLCCYEEAGRKCQLV